MLAILAQMALPKQFSSAAADRILVMEKGRLVDDGPPRKIFQQIEKMKKRGLDVPLAAEIAWRLRRQGMPLPEDIMTDEELVASLCP